MMRWGNNAVSTVIPNEERLEESRKASYRLLLMRFLTSFGMTVLTLWIATPRN